MPMLIQSSRDPHWLSNSWLVADEPGGKAVLIDTGAPMEPLLAFLEEQRLELTAILNTHHHPDHVQFNTELHDQYACPICAHTAEQELVPGFSKALEDGDEIRCGALHIRALHIPGHTSGQLAFLVNENSVFTGDTLFRDSVGGTRGHDHTSFEDLHHSVMERLMALPPETKVYPGHMETTTIGREWQENPFVRLWRGMDTVQEKDCTVFGQEARLLLRAQDYDGGSKCWVRFADGKLDLVPGSRVLEADQA